MEISFPQIKFKYEVLELSDGSLLINGAEGRQFHIKTPPPFAKTLLDLCLGQLSVDLLIERMTELFPSQGALQFRTFLKKLCDLGIVSQSLESQKPQSMDERLFSRFITEISYLQKYESKDQTCFDFFNNVRNAKVTIIGLGGNGSLLAMMLAASGVGSLHLVEGDHVEESNLVRQIFYTEADAKEKRFKADCLKERLELFSSHTSVTVSKKFMQSEKDVEAEISNSDCLILCADMPRFILNRWVSDACEKHNVPNLNAFAGMIGPFHIPGSSPCFHCLEIKFKKKFGDLQKEIVSALQTKRPCPYPSFVSGPVATAQIQFDEVFAYISKTKEPKTTRGILLAQLEKENYDLEPFGSDELCEKCAPRLNLNNGKRELYA